METTENILKELEGEEEKDRPSHNHTPGTTSRLSPSKAIKKAFWLSPLLTCAVGVLLIYLSSAESLAAGGVAIICALIQSLYACWVSPRIQFAMRILSVSTAVPPKFTALLVQSIFTCILYLSFLVSGIGGATALRSSFSVLFISIILLSMARTMHVIKNLLQVTVSRIKYMRTLHAEQMLIQMRLSATHFNIQWGVYALAPSWFQFWGLFGAQPEA
ncbi:hypothetical protein ACLB2K_006857 [Fragaria x ananassa]